MFRLAGNCALFASKYNFGHSASQHQRGWVTFVVGLDQPATWSGRASETEAFPRLLGVIERAATGACV